MENENLKDKSLELPEKAYKILSRAQKGEDITVRDDQYEFPSLLDSVKICRQKGFRFRLIDSGNLDRFQLEWLAGAGADVYTSDEVRKNLSEFDLVNRACKKGGAIFGYFFHGSFEPDEEQDSISFFDLLEMGRTGIYLYCTNRVREREIAQLNELAYACKKGGGWLVYYHNGTLEHSFEELGRNGAWIHITDLSIRESENAALVLDELKFLLSVGLNLVLHLENEMDFSLLRDVIRAGALVLFKSSLFDYKSPFRELEKEVKRKNLDFRAYYLYPTFLP
ncbi:MAG: hypothetical protein WBC02_05565 [Candidatus Aminicenantaceae bacterium]